LKELLKGWPVTRLFDCDSTKATNAGKSVRRFYTRVRKQRSDNHEVGIWRPAGYGGPDASKVEVHRTILLSPLKSAMGRKLPLWG
ncbi:MAG: hypothetical protein ABI617_06425, partial [Sphingomicrobium sp.]